MFCGYKYVDALSILRPSHRGIFSWSVIRSRSNGDLYIKPKALKVSDKSSIFLLIPVSFMIDILLCLIIVLIVISVLVSH